MTFIDAIASKKPLTRPDKTWYSRRTMYFEERVKWLPGILINPEYFLKWIEYDIEDVLATDWIIQGFQDNDFETVE